MSLVNLLPEDYVAWRKQKRTSLLCASLFGVVVVGVLAAALASERNSQHTRQVRDRVDEAYQGAEKMIQQLQSLEARRQKMLQKAILTAGLQEPVLRSYLLARVTEALPEGGSLLRFKLEAKRVRRLAKADQGSTRYGRAAAKRGAKPDGPPHLETVITLTGYAATDVEVAQFIAAMAREPLMESVDMVYTEEKEIDKVMVREFQVVMRLKPAARLINIAKTGSGDAGKLALLANQTGETK